MRRPLSEEIKGKVIYYYKQNVALAGIAKYLKISYSSVERVVRQAVWDNEITPRGKNFGKSRPAKGEGKGRQYYYEKKGYDNVRGCKCLPPDKQEELLADYKAGMTYADLMAKYGIWQKQIKAIVDRAGCPPRYNKGKAKGVTPSPSTEAK